MRYRFAAVLNNIFRLLTSENFILIIYLIFTFYGTCTSALCTFRWSLLFSSVMKIEDLFYFQDRGCCNFCNFLILPFFRMSLAFIFGASNFVLCSIGSVFFIKHHFLRYLLFVHFAFCFVFLPNARASSAHLRRWYGLVSSNDDDNVSVEVVCRREEEGEYQNTEANSHTTEARLYQLQHGPAWLRCFDVRLAPSFHTVFALTSLPNTKTFSSSVVAELARIFGGKQKCTKSKCCKKMKECLIKNYTVQAIL